MYGITLGLNKGMTCAHCGLLERHSDWCPRVNIRMAYVWGIVDNPERIGTGDALTLHGLGIKWDERQPILPAHTPSDRT